MSSAKRPRLTTEEADDQLTPRKVAVVGFLGISDYGLGQLKILASRYEVAFATSKAKSAKHAEGLEGKLQSFCELHGIEFLGPVNANSDDIVERARKTDLLIIGGYDAILKGPVLEAPRHGVLNTHLGVLPLNRGCCPTMWGQLHGVPQGYTTYHVGLAIDHGVTLDCFTAEDGLGGLLNTNREVYDSLATSAVERFGAALDRFERGEVLQPCTGKEAYHRKGLPNDSWMSFHWSNRFLRRFSLALDFAPYLPGKTCVDGEEEDLFLGVESPMEEEICLQAAKQKVGQVLHSQDDHIVVRTREGQLRCRVCKGKRPEVGAILKSCGGEGAHPIDLHFPGDVLPLERYLRSTS